MSNIHLSNLDTFHNRDNDGLVRGRETSRKVGGLPLLTVSGLPLPISEELPTLRADPRWKNYSQIHTSVLADPGLCPKFLHCSISSNKALDPRPLSHSSQSKHRITHPFLFPLSFYPSFYPYSSFLPPYYILSLLSYRKRRSVNGSAGLATRLPEFLLHPNSQH